MKRVASILLLGILLFNWVGYRLFSAYLENKAESKLESQLDESNFDESALISIKVPNSHLSYYNLSNTFERVDGKVNIKGVSYKYVKRRLFNDSLELLCIPNQAVMNLQSAKDNFFTLVNDLQHNGAGKKTDSHAFAKIFFTDGYTLENGVSLSQPSFTILEIQQHYNSTLTHEYSFTAEHPPDFIA